MTADRTAALAAAQEELAVWARVLPHPQDGSSDLRWLYGRAIVRASTAKEADLWEGRFVDAVIAVKGARQEADRMREALELARLYVVGDAHKLMRWESVVTPDLAIVDAALLPSEGTKTK